MKWLRMSLPDPKDIHNSTLIIRDYRLKNCNTRDFSLKTLEHEASVVVQYIRIGAKYAVREEASKFGTSTSETQ